MQWRPIEPADTAAWCRLLAAIEAADRRNLHFAEPDVAALFSEPGTDFARGSAAVCAGSQMIGYAFLTADTTAEPVHTMRHEGGVHPDYRDRGLGGRLLDWGQQAAVPLHEELFPGQALALGSGCLSRDSAAIALHAAHGFIPERYFHAMTRELAGPVPAVALQTGLQLASFTQARSAQALSVLNDAFRDHWEWSEITTENWEHMLGLPAFRPGLSFLAYDHGEPLGVLLAEEWGVASAATGVRDYYISMVGTRRSARGRGIASALLGHALAAAREAGYDTASLGVDVDSPTGALRIYQRAGFGIRDTWTIHVKPLTGRLDGHGSGSGG